ncbi:uncharacterized protein LOC126778807 [Nymphalis io]|uniref:uncharacterized protein LOC126778807 n=1 Tax=Inachis io TaxID=171585 RepID=UPI002169D5C8|nr:uncharacterized protein LOC126778807 [Nymphalis io]
MENNVENNKVNADLEREEYDYFSFNFVNEPWDDRSNRSKIGIISLLVAIFISTIALVFNNLVMHYRGFDSEIFFSNVEIDCNLVKVDEYPYAARIHSVASNEVICIGAVVSSSYILANELCIKSGPIRLRLGNPIQPRCKKGFSVDTVDIIPHDGGITKSLVLLSSFENMRDCIKTIKIGVKVDLKRQFYIIGRPFRGERTLPLQIARFIADNYTNGENLHNLNGNKTICVQTVGKCPVRAGDLLVQKGRLLGLSSTSVHSREKTNYACFANLSIVNKELKAFDVEVDNK